MTYEYPLAWPPGFPRTKFPERLRFRHASARVNRNPELG
jgi:hypothetical protein